MNEKLQWAPKSDLLGTGSGVSVQPAESTEESFRFAVWTDELQGRSNGAAAVRQVQPEGQNR